MLGGIICHVRSVNVNDRKLTKRLYESFYFSVLMALSCKPTLPLALLN
jgi:hypothetical protein